MAGTKSRRNLGRVAVRRHDERTQALAEILSELLRMDQPSMRGGEVTELDIHYDSGEGHPLRGRGMPDLDVVIANEPTRAFELIGRSAAGGAPFRKSAAA